MHFSSGGPCSMVDSQVAIQGGPLVCPGREVSRLKNARRKLTAAFLASAALAAVYAMGGFGLGTHQRPNVVLIIIDTLRADRLGVYGFEKPVSPEIDELAERGVRFEHTIAQSTWTRPSIGSMLTSLYPRTLGIYSEAREILNDHFITLPEVLQQAGYTTIGATANPNINSYFNFDQGFDAYIDSRIVAPFMPAREGEALALDQHPVMSRELLAEVLRKVDDEVAKPTYLQVNLMEVHEWHDARQDLAPFDGLFGGNRYLQAVRKVSADVGAFLEDLLSRPGWEQTLVIVTSDHGETLRDHPSLASPKWHGYLVYETQARVPLIFRSTTGDLPEGAVVEQPVSLLDLMPTVLDYVGVAGPDAMRGRSLMPALRDPAAKIGLGEAFVIESQFKGSDKIALYAGEWKYVENRDDHSGTSPRELHRMGQLEDGTRTDLSSEYPDVAERMAGALSDWERSNAKAPPTLAVEEPSAEEARQLHALGYID